MLIRYYYRTDMQVFIYFVPKYDTKKKEMSFNDKHLLEKCPCGKVDKSIWFNHKMTTSVYTV